MRLSGLTAACGLLLSSLGAAQSNLTIPNSSRQILQGSFMPPQVFENVNLVRNTNLDKGYVRETINVVVANVDQKPQSEYYLPFEYEVMGRVGGLEVRDKKNLDKGRFQVRAAGVPAVFGEDGSAKTSTQYYIIRFPEPLQPKAQITLAISYHVLSSLTPLPATIKQDEKQYLTYSFSAYFPSIYPTLKQKTKVKFPNTDIPEYTTTTGLTSSSDPERQGSSYTYGPYDTAKIPPGTTHPVTVRYEFTKPLLVCSVLERDLEISQWGGNLATEERYWLRNDAASLIDHFSRVTWASQNFYKGDVAALKELRVPLKAGSMDPYFVDDIGNVSTSRFRPNNIREASLELKPRYPVFGGWKYSFKIGWNNALSTVLRKLKTGNTYALRVPFLEGPKMPEGIQYEHVVVRVILPEGATDVRWETVGGTGLPNLQADLSLHKTFMDTVGRSELKLSAMNVIDDARDAELVIIYDYPFTAAFRKPLSIFAGVVTLFTVAWAIGNLDMSIGRKR